MLGHKWLNFATAQFRVPSEIVIKFLKMYMQVELCLSPSLFVDIARFVQI